MVFYRGYVSDLAEAVEAYTYVLYSAGAFPRAVSVPVFRWLVCCSFVLFRACSARVRGFFFSFLFAYLLACFLASAAAGVGLVDDLNDLSFAFGKAPFLGEVPGVLNLNALHALSGEEVACDEQGRPRDVGLRKLASM